MASTIDHIPPRILFDLKIRPSGLEFSSCEDCNLGAAKSDLVAGFLSRIYPDNQNALAQAEFTKILRAISRDIPGLLEEIHTPRAKEKLSRDRYGIKEEGGFLQIGNTIAGDYLELFGARLGLAMHFERTGSIVPQEGGVALKVFSNVEMAEGKIPEEVFELAGEPMTLTQGQNHVGDQFRYGVAMAEGGTMTMTLATFRRSFSILAFAAADIKNLDPAGGDRIYRPGSLKLREKPRFRSGARWGNRP